MSTRVASELLRISNALDKLAAKPSYKDYVEEKKRKKEKPLSKDEWESKILGKGKKDKGDKKLHPKMDEDEDKATRHYTEALSNRKPKVESVGGGYVQVSIDSDPEVKKVWDKVDKVKGGRDALMDFVAENYADDVEDTFGDSTSLESVFNYGNNGKHTLELSIDDAEYHSGYVDGLGQNEDDYSLRDNPKKAMGKLDKDWAKLMSSWVSAYNEMG